MAKLVPHKCVDRFQLGITTEVVVEYLGQPNIAENIGSHLYWDYQSECLSFEFNEKNKHAGIFNGVITSQCCEIMEYSSSKEIAISYS